MKTYEVLCSVTVMVEAESKADASFKAMTKLAEIGIAPVVIDIEGDDPQE